MQLLPILLLLKQVISDGGGCYSKFKLIIQIVTGNLGVKIKYMFV